MPLGWRKSSALFSGVSKPNLAHIHDVAIGRWANMPWVSGSEGRRHQAGQIDKSLGVTPLVVVPADDLHQITSDFGEP
jgi:hypothetical protein